MPTRDVTEDFLHDFARLTSAQRAAFLAALEDFIADCDSGRFRAALRVHKLKDRDAWSMTWARDGRALFQYGESQLAGKRHIIWLAIGSHEIYKG
jgi:hypothetical protein